MAGPAPFFSSSFFENLEWNSCPAFELFMSTRLFFSCMRGGRWGTSEKPVYGQPRQLGEDYPFLETILDINIYIGRYVRTYIVFFFEIWSENF